MNVEPIRPCDCPEAQPLTHCPKHVRCPLCDAPPGSRCVRPSGHEASSLHAHRVEVAERLDYEAGAAWTKNPELLAQARKSWPRWQRQGLREQVSLFDALP